MEHACCHSTGLKPHAFSGEPSDVLITQECGLAPEGGAPARVDVDSIAVWRGERNTPPLERSAPRPRYVTAFPRGNDVPRNQQTVFGWQGAPCPTRLFSHKPGSSGKALGRRAPAVSASPLGLKTPWRAAGCSPILSTRLNKRSGICAAHRLAPTHPSAPNRLPRRRRPAWRCSAPRVAVDGSRE